MCAHHGVEASGGQRRGALSSWAAVSWLDWATESVGLGGLGLGNQQADEATSL